MGINQSSATNTVNNFKFLDREKVSWVGFYDLKKRNFDPTIGVFTSVDELSDQEEQESLSPYQYGWNNPILRSDPNGDCPVCPIVIPFLPEIGVGLAAVGEAIAGTAIGVGLAYLVKNAKAYPGSGYSPAVGLAMSTSTPGELTSAKSNSSKATNSSQTQPPKNDNSEKGNYNRVKPRKETIEKVKENQPKNEKGEMIDPNTKKPLKQGEIDLGHKPGNEWRKRKEMHKHNNSSRKEVLNKENDPNLYQLEDRKSNRSHKYEQKK